MNIYNYFYKLQIFKSCPNLIREIQGIPIDPNKPEDVDALIYALQDIVFRKKEFVALYHVDENGNYVHNTFRMEVENHYSVSDFVSKYLNN